jgi:glutaredoxin
MRVIVYSKTGCPWARELMDFLNEKGIRFEERDVTANPQFAQECLAKSGQLKSPTLDINGKIIADAGVEDVASYLERTGKMAA